MSQCAECELTRVKIEQLQTTISQLRRHLDGVQSCGECSVCRWHDYSPDEDAALAQKPEEEAKP